MKARIREKLLRPQVVAPADSVTEESPSVAPINEPYFTPKQVGERLKLHPDTVKALFQNETEGVIRLGNRASTQYRRRYVVERYSASAVERLIRRLQHGDPRYSEY